MTAVEDNTREVEWRDLADTVFVFVRFKYSLQYTILNWLQDGLFAAFLSAFLVFTVLKLNQTAPTSQWTCSSTSLNNSTTRQLLHMPLLGSHSPPSTAMVSICFFLSLALVLIDGFLAMLVNSWLREFDRGWRRLVSARRNENIAPWA